MSHTWLQSEPKLWGTYIAHCEIVVQHQVAEVQFSSKEGKISHLQNKMRHQHYLYLFSCHFQSECWAFQMQHVKHLSWTADRRTHRQTLGLTIYNRQLPFQWISTQKETIRPSKPAQGMPTCDSFIESRLVEELEHWTDQGATGQKEQQREGECGTPTAELKNKIEGDLHKFYNGCGE